MQGIIRGEIEILHGVDLSEGCTKYSGVGSLWCRSEVQQLGCMKQSGVELTKGGFEEDEVAALSGEVWACTR